MCKIGGRIAEQWNHPLADEFNRIIFIVSAAVDQAGKIAHQRCERPLTLPQRRFGLFSLLDFSLGPLVKTRIIDRHGDAAREVFRQGEIVLSETAARFHRDKRKSPQRFPPSREGDDHRRFDPQRFGELQMFGIARDGLQQRVWNIGEDHRLSRGQHLLKRVGASPFGRVAPNQFQSERFFARIGGDRRHPADRLVFFNDIDDATVGQKGNRHKRATLSKVVS
ncbi:MAG: hypothetical protein MPW15_08530 [Candidatus Manganitrophus sp.]|nr:hypothetical protein [Candidatus Manganitrophus sp.]